MLTYLVLTFKYIAKVTSPGPGILYIKTGRMALRSKAVLPIGVLIFGKIYCFVTR